MNPMNRLYRLYREFCIKCGADLVKDKSDDLICSKYEHKDLSEIPHPIRGKND